MNVVPRFSPDPDTTYEEDMQILRVIEAYCTSNKRHTQAVSGEEEQSRSVRFFL